jgi:glc operon protein GlcG
MNIFPNHRESNEMKMKAGFLSSAIAVLIGVAAVSLGPSAFAQNIDKFVISDTAAKKTLFKYQINADTAEKIVDACVDFAKQHDMGATIFVLSPDGEIVHSHRMDGQVPINIETALMKAKSVVYTRDSTHARANMVAGNLPLQMKWTNIGVFPTPGGLPIMVGDEMIGAIGVGGSRMDEQCAYTALTQVVGPQPPLLQSPSAPK